MYHHISGDLVELHPTSAIVEAAGIGFELGISLNTYRAIKGQKRVRLLTHFLVREEVQRLFGFATDGERELFRTILRISGVGPGIALTLLSGFEIEEFKRIVRAGDVAALRQVKGIGPKLSDRLLVELKDQFPVIEAGRRTGEGGAAGGKGFHRGGGLENVVGEALRALLGLGFSRKDGEQRLEAALETLSGRRDGGGTEAGRQDVTVEILLTEALRLGT